MRPDRSDIGDVITLVGEFQELDIGDAVRPVPFGDHVADGVGIVGCFADDIVCARAPVDRDIMVAYPAVQRIIALKPEELVVAGASGQMIVRLIAGHVIIARTANSVLDQRARIMIVEIGVEDIPGRQNHRRRIGMLQLLRGQDAPAAWLKTYGHVLAIVREIIGVFAIPIPDRHENDVPDGGALFDECPAILADAFFARGGIPLVDCFAGMGGVIRAVKGLQGPNVVHHGSLDTIADLMADELISVLRQDLHDR